MLASRLRETARTRRLLWHRRAALLLTMLIVSLAPVRPAAPAVAAGNACADVPTLANKVVHFYLALDRRQLLAATSCLTSASQSVGLSVISARTVATRLLIADQLANGLVSIDLHVTDRTAGGYVVTTYTGLLRGVPVNGDTLLAIMSLRIVRRLSFSYIPATNVVDVLAFDKQKLLRHVHADLTGDGIPDDLYLTRGVRGQQVWVFSHERLVFAEIVPTLSSIVFAGTHPGFGLRTAVGLEAWIWMGDGFGLSPSVWHSWAAGSSTRPIAPSPTPLPTIAQAPTPITGQIFGAMSISPSVLHAGQSVVASGFVPRAVPFSPPYLVLQSVRTHVVTRYFGPCSGTRVEPVANAVVAVAGTAGAAAGAGWQVSFTVPRRLYTATSDGIVRTINTPPGYYFVTAVFTGLTQCSFPPRPGDGYLTILR